MREPLDQAFQIVKRFNIENPNCITAIATAIRQAIEAEREACAKVADDLADLWDSGRETFEKLDSCHATVAYCARKADTARSVAITIRARNQGGENG